MKKNDFLLKNVKGEKKNFPSKTVGSHCNLDFLAFWAQKESKLHTPPVVPLHHLLQTACDAFLECMERCGIGTFHSPLTLGAHIDCRAHYRKKPLEPQMIAGPPLFEEGTHATLSKNMFNVGPKKLMNGVRLHALDPLDVNTVEPAVVVTLTHGFFLVVS